MPKVSCGFMDDGGVSGRDRLTAVGPTIQVQIGFDPEFQAGGNSPPDLPTHLHPALVDTGALASCIDSDLAISLQLPVVSREKIASALGPGEVNMHLAQVYIQSLDRWIIGRFAGVHLIVGGQPHSALIGRTFLQHFKMSYDGPRGHVEIETT